MKSERLVLTAFLLFIHSFAAMAQTELVLKHQRHPGRTKKLNLERVYDIKTADTTYVSRIIGFTDSTILIPARLKTGKDTVYVRSYTYTKFSWDTYMDKEIPRDTTITNRTVVPLYRSDTLAIQFADVCMLRRDLFRSTRWVEPFGWVLAGAVLGVVMLPVAAIDEGKQAVHDWLIFEGVLLGVSLPPIYLGTRRIKHDLRRKWKLSAR